MQRSSVGFPQSEEAMITVDVHEAKKQLSRLVDRAAQGEPFIIAKAGKPLVKVSALHTPAGPSRLGFMAGEITVPDDFDRMVERKIAALFGAA
jgi:antitoxin (DNA-binding transcriptional repressor) of toxin-antitoxin stability system